MIRPWPRKVCRVFKTRQVAFRSNGPSRRWALASIIAIGALLIGAATGWAIATVIAVPEEDLEASQFTVVDVSQGKVGSELSLNVVAQWSQVPVASNRAAGTVTEVSVTEGQEVVAGSALYLVDQRPVVIAQGKVPSFRHMGRSDTGADVTQMQTLLASLGLYRGPVDGVFDVTTERAVRAWQSSLGLKADGVVMLGDVIFVPSLPVRISLDSELIYLGAILIGDEPAIRALPKSPTFSVPVTEAQAALMPEGTLVKIDGPAGDAWTAFTFQREWTDQGSVLVELSPASEGLAICADACESIPPTGEVLLPARIVTVETVEGLILPSASLVADGSGKLFVIDRSGARHSVVVVASAKGMSVVEGVQLGMSVRLPASMER